MDYIYEVSDMDDGHILTAIQTVASPTGTESGDPS